MTRLNLIALCVIGVVLGFLMYLTWDYYATQQADKELVETLSELEQTYRSQSLAPNTVPISIEMRPISRLAA